MCLTLFECAPRNRNHEKKINYTDILVCVCAFYLLAQCFVKPFPIFNIVPLLLWCCCFCCLPFYFIRSLAFSDTSRYFAFCYFSDYFVFKKYWIFDLNWNHILVHISLLVVTMLVNSVSWGIFMIHTVSEWWFFAGFHCTVIVRIKIRSATLATATSVGFSI